MKKFYEIVGKVTVWSISAILVLGTALTFMVVLDIFMHPENWSMDAICGDRE